MRVITVANRQTLLDIAIQEYGSVEGVFDLLADDPSVMNLFTYTDPAGFVISEPLGLMSNLTAGQKVKIKAAPASLPIYNYYLKGKLKPINNIQFNNETLVQVVSDHNIFDYNPEDYN